MANIYELTENFLQLQTLLQSGEYTEEDLADTMELINCEIEEKAENYAKLIKNIESTIEGRKAEIERLTNANKSDENKIKYLKKNLEETMRLTGKTKFKTDLFSFAIQKNGGKRKITLDADIENIPTDFRIPQPDKVDTDKIRDYFSKNEIEKCDFAHLEPQTESLRIR